MTAASPVVRFRKRPVVISAIRWTGDNEAEVREFAGGLFGTVDPEDRSDDPDITAEVLDKLHSTWVGVKTGQWVVRGVRGELYPLDDEVRLETYDPAGEPETGGLAPGEGELAAARLLTAHAHEAIAAAIGRAEAAEAKVAEARAGIGNFLAEYGDSEVPMFKVAQDLANSLRKILGDEEVPGA